MKKTLLLLAALAALLSAGACGGAGLRLTHQEYEQEMQAIARDMNARGSRMERLASAPSNETFITLLRELEELVAAAADRVGALKPPEEIDEPHETLTDSLHEVADILDEAADEAEDGDLLAAMGVLGRAPEELDADVRGAIRDIRTAGFYIGDEGDWG